MDPSNQSGVEKTTRQSILPLHYLLLLFPIHLVVVLVVVVDFAENCSISVPWFRSFAKMLPRTIHP